MTIPESKTLKSKTPKLKTPKVVVLTGAGISAESGLKTFRDNNGLWEDHRVEDVATPEAFAQNPALVYRFYNLRREGLLDAEPNAAHLALKDLEHALGHSFLLITQNVDNLHEKAGSRQLHHMHGELTKARCTHCHQVFKWQQNLDETDHCPACNSQGSLRPHIVWFGEMPLFMDEIYQALSQCELFIAIGTSGNVYPAAGFFDLARQNGAKTVELNLEPSLNASAFNEGLYGPATQVAPDYVQRLINTLSPSYC
ncbi:NAD-dependent protein deacylase [Simiduia curdlanivorans]|uniref:NAD-dependent protein deacylase n=1 Tax=Simiduia curdlanivorans TaxID=1492769 RepID=A0ABV8V296_9GAMM|nr:Sir2 family NAD+-dependent deacetylase [Simiduia curdlanivorans]MDN3640200.1 NAD-dependent protein deacylase [Simiduia curdlanivorans]